MDQLTNNNFVNNVRYVILGPVSAGKSTFFNALFTQTCSDMKRKKTTMLPQHYHIVHDKKADTTEQIYEKNKQSNDEILLKRENKTFDYKTDFKEIYHKVNPLADFVSLPDKNATYSILDMPGLNCGGDDMYYDYIATISHNIDIYFVLFDINSGLNTSDEIKIIDLVVNEVKKNKHGYIYFLINKCDDLEFEEDGTIIFSDDELLELYNRSIEIINLKCEHIVNQFSVMPICSSKLYIYRGVKNDIDLIDEKQLDTIIKSVCGSRELKKINSIEKKRDFISGLLKDTDKKKKDNDLYESWMTETGYHLLKHQLATYINCNYNNIIFHHIEMEIDKVMKEFSKMCSDNETIYNKMINEMFIFDKLITNVVKVTKLKTLPKFIVLKIKEYDTLINGICHLVTNSISTCNKENITIIDSVISMIEKYCKQINKYINDCASNYKFVNDQKQKMMIDFFVKHFDDDIYENIKSYVTEEQLYKSIETTINSENNDVIPLKILHDIYYIMIKNQSTQTSNHISTLFKVSFYMLEKTYEEYYYKFIQTNDSLLYTKMYLMRGLNTLSNSHKFDIFQTLCVIFNVDAKMTDDGLLNICNLYRVLFVDSIPSNRSIFLEWRRMQNSGNHILRYIYYKIQNDILKLDKFQYTSCANFSIFNRELRFFDKINSYLKHIFNQNITEKIKFVPSCDEISEKEVIVDDSSEQTNELNDNEIVDNDDTSSTGSKDVYKKAMKNSSKTAEKLLKLGENSSKKLKH